MKDRIIAMAGLPLVVTGASGILDASTCAFIIIILINKDLRSELDELSGGGNYFFAITWLGLQRII